MTARPLATGAALAALLAGCGGGTPTAPPAPVAALPTAPTGLASGDTLTFLSGASSEPLPRATVRVGAQSYTSDGAGRVALAEAVAFGSNLDVTAEGMLDRQTLLRAGDRTFILWPRRTQTGIDEGYTSFIVYGDGAASRPLLRLPDAAEVVIVPAAEVLADDLSHAMHVAAVARVNETVAGMARYVLARERPATGVVFESRHDPGDPACADRIRAQVSWSHRNNEIQGGRIVFCSWDAARTGTVLHELGHTLGFSHSPNSSDVMYSTFVRGRNDVFSARETLTLALMMRRRPGNRFPDRDADRPAAMAAAVEETSVSCR